MPSRLLTVPTVFDQQPVIAVAALVAQDHGRTVQTVHRDVEEAVVVEVAESHPARGAWHRGTARRGLRNVLEPARWLRIRAWAPGIAATGY